MFYFKGSSCSHCGENFVETDDIVACPVCGSPHHRSCYGENGGCANEALHEEGFSWKRDNASEEEQSEKTDSKVIFCGICGAENNSGRLYCHNCGKPLFDDSANGQAGESEYADFNRQHYDFSDKEELDGVRLRDLSRFIGSSGPLYASLFQQMHKMGRKVCFNIFALIFPSFWYLTRKMYGSGIFIILYNLAVYCYSLLFYGIYSQMYDATMKFDSDLLMSICEEHPVIMGIFMASGVISFIISVVSGLYGANIFKKWAVRRVKRLRKKYSDDDVYNKKLDSYGRSGTSVAIVIMLVYFALTFALERFVPTIM